MVAASRAGLGFDEVVRLATAHGYGIGLWFSGDGLVGIDLDHCVTDGKLSPDAAGVVQDLGLYNHWILGQDARPPRPHWSILRDVLHWSR